MGRGQGSHCGTGYPLSFACHRWRRTRDWRSYGSAEDAGHVPVLTGQTKKVYDTKGHHRKLHTSYQYRCQCGHVGWSTHPGVLQLKLAEGAEMGQQYPTKWDQRVWKAPTS